MSSRCFCWIVLVLTVVGCTERDATNSADHAVPTSANTSDRTASSTAAEAGKVGTVVVVGDHTAAEVAKQLRDENVEVSEERAQLSRASLVVIAQSASDGPTAIHKELAEEISHGNKPVILWVQTNTHLINDAELLELEELEVRELLNTHGLPGDTVQFALDTETSPLEDGAQHLRGWQAIRDFVQQHQRK